MALVACVVLVVSLTMHSDGAFAKGKDPLKHKKAQVHAKVHHAKGDLDSSSHRLRKAMGRLTHARKRLHSAQRELAHTRSQLQKARQADRRMRARLQEARRRLDRAQRAVEEGKQDVADQKVAIGQMAASNFQNGSPDLLGLVAMLQADGPADVTTRLNTVHNIMAKQAATLQELRDIEVRLQRREAKLADVRREVADRREQTRATLQHKRDVEKVAREQKQQVANLVSSRRHVAAKARRIRAHDRAVLKHLQRKEARIKRQILARARHQANRRVANTGGLLYRPVPGYITSPFGWREHPIYHYWGLHDGDDFHAPCGTPERAAGTGTVVKEYYSSVWGHRLYLDLGRINGHNFTVIYNHISRYAVGSGAHVGRGQVVAYAGTTGWSTGCHLHFTVLRDGTAVNPMNFM